LNHFFENYAFKVQNEIQDLNWFSFQIMILVHITYWLNPTYDPIKPRTKILKEVHYYVSYEKEHDTLFVQNVFQLNWGFLQERGCFPKKHVVWSNGCSG